MIMSHDYEQQQQQQQNHIFKSLGIVANSSLNITIQKSL